MKKMSKRTLNALRKSIKHWEENAAAKDGEYVSISDSDCALCKLFFEKPHPDVAGLECWGCPVFMATGRDKCRGTPYSTVMRALGYLADGFSTPKFRLAAAQELAFLKSLLPAGENP